MTLLHAPRNTALMMAPFGAVALLAAPAALAATPTYHADLASFDAAIAVSVTDDYSNPGYGIF